ncbi:NAD(P)H-dependent oxidoreductase subunit E, partial [Zoogloea sp.]|uniref:NADH-quinone oxidoreductase subunit NuoE family protein n=1 Tax=Zoogloea sp. TaxID=49181 RepID=UPI002C28C229
MSALPSNEYAALDGILQRHRHDPTRLLQVLIDAQDIAGWLPAASLTHIAAALKLPRARVEGVAGFYSFLYTHPVGRYRVLFSDNITDRML